MRHLSFHLASLSLGLLWLASASAQHAQKNEAYLLKATYHIASSGGWDYLTPGPGNNRLYVSHGTQVNVLDETTGDSVGIITGTTGVHGIAFAPGSGKGYTSNGRLNNISVFDLSSNQVTGQIATGENPDAIMYEPFSKTIITCNGRSKDLTVIDPATEKVVATVPVGGKPETAVSDANGHIYVNIEDKNEILEIDMKTYSVKRHFSLAPGEGPTGLAINRKDGKLFAGCEKLLLVVDIAAGTITDKITIADGCDGVAYDAGLHNVLASCGEGKLAVIKPSTDGHFSLADNIASKRGARTIAIDETTHAVFLPTADFGTPAAGERRPPMIAGTFQVLVFRPAKQ
jgi:YVTN family beta-propeller protein